MRIEVSVDNSPPESDAGSEGAGERDAAAVAAALVVMMPKDPVGRAIVQGDGLEKVENHRSVSICFVPRITVHG